jgi:16S rRNA (cytosine1402-N4)-methyltransferase
MTSGQLGLPGVLLPADSTAEWIWENFDEESDVQAFVHATVMRDEVVHALAPAAGGVYVDVTAGAGGHAEAILEAAEGARVVGLDRDPAAVVASRERLARFGDRARIVRASFGGVVDVLAGLGIAQVDGVCADLGLSSPQLDDPARGMSFRREGPIDMRMDPEAGETALDLIARSTDEELADVLYRFGDEHRSRRIARSIHRAFAQGELETTLDLRRAIVRAVGPARIGGVDPATRTFQALRIAVNEELRELEVLLAALPGIVRPGGTIAIISFHSLEDRLVKRALLDRGAWEPLWKKPLTPSDEEASENPRARSAKLRAARRLPPEATLPEAG